MHVHSKSNYNIYSTITIAVTTEVIVAVLTNFAVAVLLFNSVTSRAAVVLAAKPSVKSCLTLNKSYQLLYIMSPTIT